MQKEINCQLSSNKCLHCGTATPDSFCEFCCTGCEQVYKILNQAGFEHYYSLKDLEEVKFEIPAEIKSNSYEYFNDLLFIEQHSKLYNKEYKQINLFLYGVQCAACVWLIDKLPSLCIGVLKADLNYSNSVVTIVYDDSKTSLQKIAQTLNNIGYPPEPYNPNEEELQSRNAIKLLLIQLGVAGFCAGNTMMIAISLYQGYFSGIAENYKTFLHWVSFFLCLPTVFFSAQPFFKSALVSLRFKQIHIDFPISLGILIGFIYSFVNTVLNYNEVYYDSICMLIFLLLIGRFLQKKGIERAYKTANLENLILPTYARVKNASGEFVESYLKTVKKDDLVKVLAGEKIAVDSTVIKGSSAVDNSFLTGESLPIDIYKGSVVFAGAINLNSEIITKANGSFYESRISKIISLIKTSVSDKSTVSSSVNKLSSYFVVCVLLLASACFLYWSMIADIKTAIMNSISLLIVTCPCALGLAAPLVIARSVGQLARKEIFVRNSEFFDRLLSAKNIYFDKTGTLTTGDFKIIKEFYEERVDKQDLLEKISILEKTSSHPIKNAFITNSNSEIKLISKENIDTQGIEGVFSDDTRLTVGSLKLFNDRKINFPTEIIESYKSKNLSIVLVALENKFVACFAVGDKVREGMSQLVAKLNSYGKEVNILSGDNFEVVHKVGEDIDIAFENLFAEKTPEEKTEIIKNKQFNCMIGDGANDAPALKASDVSIGVGGSSEVNLLVADSFIRNFSSNNLLLLFDTASRVKKAIIINIIFSLLYNILGAGLAFMGYLNPLYAAILMPISSFTVILLALNFKIKDN